MPPPKNIDFYENPFGYELRRHRERLDMTQAQLSERLGYSDDIISKVETGQAPPSEAFARDCDTMFGTHGAMESLARLVRKGGAFRAGCGSGSSSSGRRARCATGNPWWSPGCSSAFTSKAWDAFVGRVKDGKLDR